MLLVSRPLYALRRFLPPTGVTGVRTRTRLAYLTDAARAHAGTSFFSRWERRRLVRRGYEVIDISALSQSAAEIDAVLNDVDGLYVGGGETFLLLSALRRSGADYVLARHVRDGLPYIGVSAGAVITGTSIAPIAEMDDASYGHELQSHDGLRLVNGVLVPHAKGWFSAVPRGVISRIGERHSDAHDLIYIGEHEGILVHEGHQQLLSRHRRHRAIVS